MPAALSTVYRGFRVTGPPCYWPASLASSCGCPTIPAWWPPSWRSGCSALSSTSTTSSCASPTTLAGGFAPWASGARPGWFRTCATRTLLLGPGPRGSSTPDQYAIAERARRFANRWGRCGSGGLRYTAGVTAGIVRCRFDRRGRQGLRCVGKQFARIVGYGCIRFDVRVRFRQWRDHGMSQPAGRCDRPVLRARRGGIGGCRRAERLRVIEPVTSSGLPPPPSSSSAGSTSSLATPESPRPPRPPYRPPGLVGRDPQLGLPALPHRLNSCLTPTCDAPQTPAARTRQWRRALPVVVHDADAPCPADCVPRSATK